MENKNKRVGIITIWDNTNYGNRLQNYAVQRVLEQLDFDTVTFFTNSGVKQRLKYGIHRLTGFRLTKNEEYWRFSALKTSRFENFNKKYIKGKYIHGISAIDKNLDYFVAGSDQIWNPSWYDALKRDMFLLTFARPQQKVCFAPSFGILEMPLEWQDFFKEQLITFPLLSVREPSGAEIIRKLTGRDAQVIIDPTLMLDAEEWMRIASKPEKIDCACGYIFTYFLGGKTAAQEKYIQELARKYSLSVYEIMDTSNRDLYYSDPSEFLFLISRAKLVLTDSFHACVFSFLLGRPFLVYQRNGAWNNMFSRIENLLDMLCLQRKFADSGLPNELLECEYGSGRQKLMEERGKAWEFLRKAFHMA